MNKMTAIIAILGVLTAGYVAADAVYRKKQKERKAYHIGDKKDFKKYQECFMEKDGKPIYYLYSKPGRASLSAHIADIMRVKKCEYEYRNSPKENSDNNYLFGTFEGQDFGLSTNPHKTSRSGNVLVIGNGMALEKANYIKANVMQENGSALIVDTSDNIFRSLAPELIAEGCSVYLFNPGNPSLSNHYNPLEHVYNKNGAIDEVQIDILIDVFMKSVYGQSKNFSDEDQLTAKFEAALLKAVIYYTLENDNIPEEDKCFNTVLKKIQSAVDSDNLTTEINAWSELMKKLGRVHKAKMYYDTFLDAPEKVRKRAIASLTANLMCFSENEIGEITKTSVEYPATNIDFDKMFYQRGYLFVIVPQPHSSYDFLLSALYCQLYGAAYKAGERSRNKYYIGYRKGNSMFDYFNNPWDAKSFKLHASKNNIVEKDYRNGTRIYDLIWKNIDGEAHSYKRSFNRKALENYVNDLDKMIIWEGDDFSAGDPAIPVYLNVFLNDFMNCGFIPNFLTILSTSRHYRIGNHCLVNSIEELKEIYQNDEHETLLANVDTVIYFGSENQPKSDIELVQKMCGKAHSEAYLMSLAEIITVGNTDNEGNRDNREIVMVRDCVPFICEKCNPKKHKRHEEFRIQAYHSGFSAKKYFSRRKK